MRIAGRHWQPALADIVTRSTAGLGVAAPVVAELYKMRVHDQGSFSVDHRDTEKTAGMFAALVVVLPSTFTGGELIMRHSEREVCLDLTSDDPSEVSFAAFYADCQHEVRPVTAGSRFDESGISPPGALDDVEPDNQDFAEATGRRELRTHLSAHRARRLPRAGRLLQDVRRTSPPALACAQRCTSKRQPPIRCWRWSRRRCCRRQISGLHCRRRHSRQQADFRAPARHFRRRSVLLACSS